MRSSMIEVESLMNVTWTTVKIPAPGIQKGASQKRDAHGSMAAKCPNIHTEEEKELFARLPKILFQYFKSSECNKKDQHITDS